jgi:hypothetical protein
VCAYYILTPFDRNTPPGQGYRRNLAGIRIPSIGLTQKNSGARVSNAPHHQYIRQSTVHKTYPMLATALVPLCSHNTVVAHVRYSKRNVSYQCLYCTTPVMLEAATVPFHPIFGTHTQNARNVPVLTQLGLLLQLVEPPCTAPILFVLHRTR